MHSDRLALHRIDYNSTIHNRKITESCVIDFRHPRLPRFLMKRFETNDPIEQSGSLATTGNFPSAHPSSLIASRTWIFDNWHPGIYAFMPAGVYAGNRFPSLCVDYSPRIPEKLLRDKETPPYITDIPRLSLEAGFSSVQLKSGDLAFPAFGLFDPGRQHGWFAIAEQPDAFADALWEIEESDDRSKACFRV